MATRRTRPTTTRTLTAFLGVLTIVAVAGCTATGHVEPVVGVTESPAAGVPISDLAVGDCFTESYADPTAPAQVVPCDRPHDWEVFYSFGVEGAEYPGQAAIQAAAEQTCAAQFDEFVGWDSSAGPSELGFTYTTPDEAGWTGVVGEPVQCLVGDWNGPVTGSLAGAAR